ncbi:hypothetical protein TTHERM_02581230 (macronuclear) [Tetrahymena thermophila SB210]|uniref:Uncharacterized protein n=1 Tax=Tetrahymena thermophila (strain SB210) TaxID=312017 RepID=Q223X3_TETTS|nr:hypothetical protein TTHERM_02581230 [Tetrahymena thermophila SB210]EAR80590.1 hypothetical protein TTHERM_02581230 [Tetrahymena thermophila SB210]|eukprot:XP_001028253.1 hypothetical protein TTHERM_02581230 [Tetrahymena thermophila SB210]
MIAQGLKRLSLLKNLKKSAQLYYFNKQAFGSDVDKNLNPYSYEALKENHWLVSDSSKKVRYINIFLINQILIVESYIKYKMRIIQELRQFIRKAKLKAQNLGIN